MGICCGTISQMKDLTKDQFKNPHILNAAANLLGVCFFIITGIRLTDVEELQEINRLVFVGSLFFVVSCLLSYLSIRNIRFTDTFEIYADYSFLIGILLLCVVMLLLTFNSQSVL
jgi:hypothetical protein